VIDAGDEAAGFHEGCQAFEFRPHGGFAPGHGHFVKMADHAELRKFLAQFHAIHSGLAFERQHAGNA